MIILDEQLLGRGLELDIAHWYRGTVQCITDVRPHTIIKDEAIPALLRRPEFRTKAQRMGKGRSGDTRRHELLHAQRQASQEHASGSPVTARSVAPC